MFPCSNGHQVLVGGSTKFASTKRFSSSQLHSSQHIAATPLMGSSNKSVCFLSWNVQNAFFFCISNYLSKMQILEKKQTSNQDQIFFHFYQNKKIWSIYNTIQSEIHIKLLDPYIEKKIKFSHERASYKRQKKNKIILIKLKNKKYPISIVNIILI